MINTIYEKNKASTYYKVGFCFVLSILFVGSSLLPIVSSTGVLTSFFLSILLAIPSTLFLFIIIRLLSKADKCYQKAFLKSDSNKFVKKSLKQLLVSFFIIIVVWGLFWLVYYPGCCSGDSHDILKMVLGKEFTSNWFRYTSLNSHHPWLYVFIIKIGQMLSPNVEGGIAIVSFLQMLIMAVVIVHTCHTVFLISRSELITMICYLFFVFNPLLIRITLSLWKDVLFGALVLLLTSMILRFILFQKQECTKIDNICILLCAFLTGLSRSGGILVPIILSGGLLLVSTNKRRMVSQIGSLLGIYIMIQIIVTSVFNIQKGHFSEAIAVPIQQISRTVVCGGELNEEEKEFLNNLLPLDQYQSAYKENTVNGIKFSNDFSDDFLENHKAAFFKHWLIIGSRNPRIYIKAWLEETKGFWHIGTDTEHYVAEIGYQLDNTQETRITNNKLPIIPCAALEYITNLYITCTKIVTRASSLFWLLMLVFIATILLKKKMAFLLTLPQCALYAVYILDAPVNQQFRYVFPCYLVFPLLCIVLIVEKGCDKTQTDEMETVIKNYQ